MKEKICEFCGESFVPNSSQQRYCKRPHYMKCPVCGKDYLVTNNENLKRPPFACSYACRKVRREETSLKRYGIKAPGNNPKAREKAKATMQERYGVDYAMQSSELKKKSQDSMIERYGVENIAKIKDISEKAHQSRNRNWIAKVHGLLPLKVQTNEQLDPRWKIEDDKMTIFLLTEEASTSFLRKYGFNIIHKFGKIHLSIGLVEDGVLYQVIRFEKHGSEINLVDFGTRYGYFNPSYYSKLMNYAINERSLTDFTATIPRNIASDDLINSLSLEFIQEGNYIVYWNIDDKFKQLSQQDNIEIMKEKYDYITSDYLDIYRFSST